MEEKFKIALGALPIPKDKRDVQHLPSANPQPVNFMTDTSMLPVLMQNQIPACVSHAVVNLMKLYWYKKSGKVIDFSPRFLDILSYTPDLTITSGRDPRLVIKLANQIGCCTTATLPNDTTLPLGTYRNGSVITQAMRDEAAQYKIPGYVFIPFDEYSFKDAIMKYGMIAICCTIGAEWWTPSWFKGDIDPLRTPNPAVGGHETCLKGWNGSLMRDLNEWSKMWADMGENDMPFPAWLPFIYGAMAITDVSPLFKFNNDMKMGSTLSPDVKELQKRLGVIQTGLFFTLTKKAVMLFQSANHLSIDGAVGPLTRAVLNK